MVCLLVRLKVGAGREGRLVSPDGCNQKGKEEHRDSTLVRSKVKGNRRPERQLASLALRVKRQIFGIQALFGGC
jgi:hypothetical protein